MSEFDERAPNHLQDDSPAFQTLSYEAWGRQELASRNIDVPPEATAQDIRAIFRELDEQQADEWHRAQLRGFGYDVDQSRTREQARELYQGHRWRQLQQECIERVRSAGVPVETYEEARAFNDLQESRKLSERNAARLANEGVNVSPEVADALIALRVAQRMLGEIGAGTLEEAIAIFRLANQYDRQHGQAPTYQDNSEGSLGYDD